MKTVFLAKVIAAGAMLVSAQAFADYNCAVLAPTSPGAEEYGQVLAQKTFADADLSKAQLILDAGTTAYAALYDEGFLTVAAVDKATGKATILASGNGTEVILMDATNERAVICKKADAQTPAPGTQALRFSL